MLQFKRWMSLGSFPTVWTSMVYNDKVAVPSAAIFGKESLWASLLNSFALKCFIYHKPKHEKSIFWKQQLRDSFKLGYIDNWLP